MAPTLDLLKALNSGGLSINSPPVHTPAQQGKVLGASTTAPTVKRYTKPATTTKTSNNPIPGPAAPALPTPEPTNNFSQPVPQPAPAPMEPFKDPVQEYYDSLDTTAPTGDEQTQIRDQARKDMQAYIDAINNEYAGLASNTAIQFDQYGKESAGMTRASAARSGTLGSDFGNAAINNDAQQTGQQKDAALKALEAEKQVRLQEVNGKIDQRARDEIAAQKAEALGNSEKYIGRLEDNQKSARDDIKTLAKSGAQIDPTKMAVLQKQSGYDPLTFESIYNANKPVPEFTAPMQLKDGTLIITDKTTGEVKNLGKYDLPNNFDFLFAPDGTPMVFDKDTGITQVASGFHKAQFAKPQTTTEKDTRTASEKEYEYAKGQGYGGSFLDYQKEAKAASSGSSNPFGT